VVHKPWRVVCVWRAHTPAPAFRPTRRRELSRQVAVNTLSRVLLRHLALHRATCSRVALQITERALAPALARLSTMQIHTGAYFARRVIGWGAPADKVVTIHNGFNPRAFHPDVVPTESLSDQTVLFTARRLVEKNGVDYLILAMPDIIAQHDAQLVIAGDGPERHHLERLVEQRGLQDVVSFLGAVPHTELPQYIRHPISL